MPATPGGFNRYILRCCKRECISQRAAGTLAKRGAKVLVLATGVLVAYRDFMSGSNLPAVLMSPQACITARHAVECEHQYSYKYRQEPHVANV